MSLTYRSRFHHYPSEVLRYQLEHDSVGGLISVTLPSGTARYGFQKIPLLGNFLVKVTPPWGNQSLKYLLHEENQNTEQITVQNTVLKVFEVRKQPFQTFITRENFVYSMEIDETGRLKSKSLNLDGKRIHFQTFTYSGYSLEKHTVIG